MKNTDANIINEELNEKDIAKDGLTRATDKLEKLLNCGNERVELSAAKEILSIAEAQAAKEKKDDEKITLEVEIKIVE